MHMKYKSHLCAFPLPLVKEETLFLEIVVSAASARSIPVYLYPDAWHVSAEDDARDDETVASEVDACVVCLQTLCLRATHHTFDFLRVQYNL